MSAGDRQAAAAANPATLTRSSPPSPSLEAAGGQESGRSFRRGTSNQVFSFLETASSLDPQREGPHRIECDCKFRKANPLGRPASAYHSGTVIEEMNEPTKKKLAAIMKNKGAGTSKVEDHVQDLLDGNGENAGPADSD